MQGRDKEPNQEMLQHKQTKRFSVFEGPHGQHDVVNQTVELVEHLQCGVLQRKCVCKEHLRCDDHFTDYFICFQCKDPLRSGKRAIYCSACMYSLCHSCSQKWVTTRPSRLIFSAHGDTCFSESFCRTIETPNGTLFWGHVDNFAGVHAMLSSYFGGSCHQERVQYQITYGEEKTINGVEFAGARDVISTLESDDMVVVIDVTGIESRPLDGRCDSSTLKGKVGHVIFEKVLHNPQFLSLFEKLSGVCVARNGTPLPVSPSPVFPRYTYELWDWCEDPQASCDESDVYRKRCQNSVFLGVPTQGGYLSDQFQSDGDYNRGPVFCWKKDIEAVSIVVNELTNLFNQHYPFTPLLTSL